MVQYLAIGPRNEKAYTQYATVAAALTAAVRDLASDEWVPVQIRGNGQHLDFEAILAALAREWVMAA
jgi:hypothetical protein